MTHPDFLCRRCGRVLAPTPANVQRLAWSDGHRVSRQGWLGRSPGEAVCVECLTVDEANFLLPDSAGRRTRTGRFAPRSSEFVADSMLP